jgi:GcrA cell cycle regulator
MTWGWTEANVEQLKKLWAQNWSAGQIAAEFGPECTRNAVIGKINRLGLSGRISVAKTEEPIKLCAIAPLAPTPTMGEGRAKMEDARRAQNLAAKSVRKPNAFIERLRTNAASNDRAGDDARALAGEGVTIIDLRPDSCRWPMGDPGSESFLYCGDRRDGAGPYCACHRVRAYQPRALRPVGYSDGSVRKTDREDAEPKELVL